MSMYVHFQPSLKCHKGPSAYVEYQTNQKLPHSVLDQDQPGTHKGNLQMELSTTLQKTEVGPVHKESFRGMPESSIHQVL